jgi:predicted ATP-grasp superfamily ATP-dependent carboligase
MIKPVLSHAFAKIFQTKLFILETFADLREKFQATLDANVAVMISEIIPGTDYETLERFHLYINSKGDATGENFYLKMRQLPPMFGVMRVGRTVPPIDDLRELGHRLLKQANYRGLANFEFKRDPRDNQLKLIEVNIRPSRGLALEVASGVDMPWLIYQDLVLNQQPIVTEYRHDIYFIDVIADIIEFLRHDEDRNFGRFIQPYLQRHKVFPFLTWSDPMPFFRQQKIRLTSGFEKLIRRLRGE